MATISLAASVFAGTQNLPLRLGEDGDIYGWLVAGPYPDPGGLQLRGTGFDTDYLHSEADANPQEGDVNGPCVWKMAIGTRSAGLDLLQSIANVSSSIGYCYTLLDSPTDREAQVLFGSDDGAKLYLNGELLYSKQVGRGLKRDDEHIAIHLKRGQNRLLFKVEQVDGPWALVARVVDAQGRRIPNLTQVLAVEPTKNDGHALARSVSGKPGSLDLDALARYQMVKGTAAHWLVRMRPQATEPDLLRSALAQELSYSDADQLSRALSSAESSIAEAYAHSRSKLLKWAQNPGPQFKVAVAKEDFVKVMPGGRYFVHADGRPFMPIGYNHNPDWTELSYGDPLSDECDPKRPDDWFANLQSHGVSVVRLMVETPPSGNIEEKPGVFRPEHILWLDTIFASARKHGIKLWVTPYDTFWMNLKAYASPYWAANGGPVAQPIDFLTKSAAIKLQKERMKFLIDRYGNTGTVFAWEIMNEIDLWWGANPQQIKAWTDQMASFVRAHQRKRWGRDHLLTISFAKAEPSGQNADTAFRRPDLDFATMHLYLGASRAPKPGQAEKAAEDFAAGVRYARAQVTDNRPVMDGESGPIDHWIDGESFDDEVFHQMSWQHLLSGGAGSGTRWPYRHPHHITPGMLDTLKSMRTFCDGVPWIRLTGPVVAVKTDGQGTIGTFCTADAGIAWIRFRPDQADRKVILLWPGSSRPTRFRLFDVRKGIWIGDVHNSIDKDGIHILLPPDTGEIAAWIQT